MSQSYTPDEGRYVASVRAAELIDVFDDEILEAHRTAVNALTVLGARLARKGLDPTVVLGQMNQCVAASFTLEIMPGFALRDAS